MKNYLISFLTGCCLLVFSASVHAAGGVDRACFDACIKAETADRCPIGAVQVCSSRCTVTTEAKAYFNGVQVSGSMQLTPQGIEYYASPVVNACNQCEAQNNPAGSENFSTTVCAVMPSSTSNLCTDLDPNFTPTVNVGLVNASLFDESIQLGKVLWNIQLVNPCFEIGGGEQHVYSGTVKCNVGVQAGGQGCGEKRKGDTTVSGLCYISTDSGCNTSTTTTKCVASSIDACADGNEVGIY